MTSYERIEAVFDGELPDKLPIYDLIRNDSIIEHYAGEKLTLDNCQELVPKATNVFLDATRSIAYPQKPRVEKRPSGCVVQIERWTSWIINYPYKDVEDLKSYAHKRIEELKIIEKISDQEIKADEEKWQDQKNKFGDVVIFYSTGEALNQMLYGEDCGGIEMFTYLKSDYPELAQEWLDVSHQNMLYKIDKFASRKKSPVGFIASDIAAKGSLIFSPAYLRESKYFKRIADICDILHQKGMKAVFHSDGYIMDLIPDLIKAGIDGLNPIEKAAGMDIKKIKALYGDKLVLAGGMDVTKLLSRGSKDEVRKATVKMIEDIALRGKFLIGSTTELGNDIPLENVLTMVETINEYGYY